MRSFLFRYAFAACILTYMGGIIALHLLGLFPRAGFYDPSRLIGSSVVILVGRVEDAPVIRWNQTRFLFSGHAEPMTVFRGKVVVTLNFVDENLAPGDRLRVRGWLSSPRPASPGRDFDEQGYWATRGVFSMLKVWSSDGLTVLRPSSSWSLERSAWGFHCRYREFWERHLPWDEASLLLGVTIGARGILPKRVKEACIRAGVYHIVVVSGQNMSLIVSLGVSLLLLARVPRRHAFWVCLTPIIFYTAAVGSDPPVVRAAATAIVGLFAAVLGRDIPRYYPILLAAGWILLREPEALLGASFQLSFGATLSILAILPLLDVSPHPGRQTSGDHPLPEGRGSNPQIGPSPFRGKVAPTRSGVGRMRAFIHWIMEAGVLGICVHIGIWPVLVYYFHRLSLAGLLANWTIFPLSGILMIFGLAVGTWGVLLPGTVPGPVVALVRSGVHMMLSLIEHMSAWPWAVRPVVPPAWWIIGLYYGFLFGILFLFHRRKTNAEKTPSAKSRSRLQRG